MKGFFNGFWDFANDHPYYAAGIVTGIFACIKETAVAVAKVLTGNTNDTKEES